MTVCYKKLIEVSLPLEAINKACALEKQPFTRRHPRSIHIWWARRPLAAARAVIFAQMVDDPSSHPDLFPTPQKQDKERKRLFKIIEDLVLWENTTNETVLKQARDEIWNSWRMSCAANADHPNAQELFDRYVLPAFHDPFAGGGALPLEAQRLGLDSYASDLNPVAVLINKAMLEIPPRFAGRPPINPDSRKDQTLFAKEWNGAKGLAEDIHYYGKWIHKEAEKRIGFLYPKISITAEMVRERSDLDKYLGKELNVIAYIWARTVKSPNPAFSQIDVPLVSTFVLSNRVGKEIVIEPVIVQSGYKFVVKLGKPKDVEAAKKGTSAGKRAAFKCVMSGTPIPYDYIRSEGHAGRLGDKLMAIVVEGDRSRLYLSPSEGMETIARHAKPIWKPDCEMPMKHRNFQPPVYGMTNLGDIFTPRQLVALTTFSDLVQESVALVKKDAISAGLADDNKTLRDGGVDAKAYAEAVVVYLSLATSRWCDLSNSLCSWNNSNQSVRALFSRQAIPMNWDYVELSPFSKMGSWFSIVEASVEASKSLPAHPNGTATQADAASQTLTEAKVVSTDPPYYDNICYADLSDFFYVWLRRSVKTIFPDIFATLSVPKAEELVASANRHGSKDKAEHFFLDGMTQVMHRLSEQVHPAFPVTIYYAFKQSEREGIDGTASTGWETFLDAVIHAGFSLTGTWPMRTERGERSIGIGANALASSIVLVCRKRATDAPTTTRREFLSILKTELPLALISMQRSNIAPVDLAQASIGPGMAIYTRFSKVLDATGKPLSVRDALTLINQTLDETLAEQEGSFDADSRWALAWFEQLGFIEGEFGVADNLARAKNTSVRGLEDAGILLSSRGKVRLLRADELPIDWDPSTDSRLTDWEVVHHLIRVLDKGGEGAAAEIVAKLGTKSEEARALCYRLYSLCERKKRSADALAYNTLVQSWPEIVRLSQDIVVTEPVQQTFI